MKASLRVEGKTTPKQCISGKVSQFFSCFRSHRSVCSLIIFNNTPLKKHISCFVIVYL